LITFFVVQAPMVSSLKDAAINAYESSQHAAVLEYLAKCEDQMMNLQTLLTTFASGGQDELFKLARSIGVPGPFLLTLYHGVSPASRGGSRGAEDTDQSSMVDGRTISSQSSDEGSAIMNPETRTAVVRVTPATFGSETMPALREPAIYFEEELRVVKGARILQTEGDGDFELSAVLEGDDDGAAFRSFGGVKGLALTTATMLSDQTTFEQKVTFITESLRELQTKLDINQAGMGELAGALSGGPKVSQADLSGVLNGYRDKKDSPSTEKLLALAVLFRLLKAADAFNEDSWSHETFAEVVEFEGVVKRSTKSNRAPPAAKYPCSCPEHNQAINERMLKQAKERAITAIELGSQKAAPMVINKEVKLKTCRDTYHLAKAAVLCGSTHPGSIAVSKRGRSFCTSPRNIQFVERKIKKISKSTRAAIEERAWTKASNEHHEL